MAGFHHILFPADFSEQSKAFRPFVRLVARQFKAQLTLLHVVPIPVGVYADMGAVVPPLTDLEVTAGRMAEVLEEFFPAPDEAGIGTVTREVMLGDPAVVIADYARTHEVDLVMMATHGYGRFRSLLMGSVASKVLHDADCAVWTAAHVEDPSAMRHLQVKSILAAVDLTAGPSEVIGRAAELAKEFGASLRLAHAVPGAQHRPGDTGGDEFGHFLLHTAREQIGRLQREAQVSYEASVEAGGVAQVICRVARETHADLVVLGRGVVKDAFGRLRSKSYEIIRESPCPVLSL